MTENKSSQTQSTGSPSDSGKSQGQGPYESVVSQVVTKIKNEPFLFVIAVAALLIGLVVLAVGLGSPDLRFIVVVIALLAFVVILGYYVQAVLQMRAKMQREAWKHEERMREASRAQAPPTEKPKPDTPEKGEGAPTPPPASKYQVDASHATGVATGDGATVVQDFGSSGQPPAPLPEKTEPDTPGKSEHAPTPPPASKYQVNASHATGVATGDKAKVVQQFGSPGRPSVPEPPIAGAFTPEEQRAALEQELAQHRRNLARLRAKKAVYAAGEEPLSLLNQIEVEEREIQRIQAELEQLTED